MSTWASPGSQGSRRTFQTKTGAVGAIQPPPPPPPPPPLLDGGESTPSLLCVRAVPADDSPDGSRLDSIDPVESWWTRRAFLFARPASSSA
mmetsp:Transcript_6963/g.13424  ORF Transcript_6963/g.13424 Transcript_6963/m.13424 type:complete len:91 (-) Transcript_6963:95-367(-)